VAVDACQPRRLARLRRVLANLTVKSRAFARLRAAKGHRVVGTTTLPASLGWGQDQVTDVRGDGVDHANFARPCAAESRTLSRQGRFRLLPLLSRRGRT